jgi:PEGA domain
MFMCAPIIEDPMLEFLAETPEEAPTRIIHVVPATFVNELPAASQYDTPSSGRIRTGRVLVLVAVTASVLRGSVGRTTQLIHAGTQSVPRMIRRFEAITTATITSTQHVRAVARVIRDGGAHHFAALSQFVAIRLPGWRVRFSRIHAPMSSSLLASFGGGIAIGAVLVSSFDLQPRTDPTTAQKGSASADATPSPPVADMAAHALDTSRQDPPRESGLRVGSAVAVRTLAAAATPLPVSPRQVAASTAQRFRGTLAIDSVTTGAHVFINGQPVGETPLLLKNVPVGSRAVRVEAAGYRAWSASVQVTANQQTSVIAKLDRVIGEIPE